MKFSRVSKKTLIPPPCGEKSRSTITVTHQCPQLAYSQVTSELLAKAFSSVSSDTSYNPELLARKTHEQSLLLTIFNENLEDYNSLLTMEELHHSVSKFIKNTVSGPDNITSIFIKQLPEIMLHVLLGIYKLWTEQTLPVFWSSAIIVPILKLTRLRQMCNKLLLTACTDVRTLQNSRENHSTPSTFDIQ